jgi:hypothetical protein
MRELWRGINGLRIYLAVLKIKVKIKSRRIAYFHKDYITEVEKV